MTREEVKEDLRKLKKSRVDSLAVPPISRRSRRMTPEERMKIRNLPSSAAATMEERVEEAAAAAPVDEEAGQRKRGSIS